MLIQSKCSVNPAILFPEIKSATHLTDKRCDPDGFRVRFKSYLTALGINDDETTHSSDLVAHMRCWMMGRMLKLWWCKLVGNVKSHSIGMSRHNASDWIWWRQGSHHWRIEQDLLTAKGSKMIYLVINRFSNEKWRFYCSLGCFEELCKDLDCLSQVYNKPSKMGWGTPPL